MEQVKRSRRLSRQRQQQLPTELIQYIQSLLPVEEAGRTTVLAKSWVQAWSTIPTLRFHRSMMDLTNQQKTNYIKTIDDTVTRYLSHNIPIITFDLHFVIESQKSASRLAESWIRPVASKPCLKELYLQIRFGIIFPFTLPDEIFSGENVEKLSVTDEAAMNNCLCINSNPVINCVNLRVLKLIHVNITQDLLDNLFSTCNLLRKVKLSLPRQCLMKSVKVKHLRYLRVLKIISKQPHDILEVDDVPSLRRLSYDASWARRMNPLSFNPDIFGRVKILFLAGVVMDTAFSEIVNSKFPCLESLTLLMNDCKLETLDITGVSLQRLRIRLTEITKHKIQVYAPKLDSFCYTGILLKSLVFLTITPPQIELRLELIEAVNNSFFLGLREVLNLSSDFKIKITINTVLPFHVDVNDVRRRVLIPATNVQRISFWLADENLWERSQFFDAFFSICRPSYIKTCQTATHYEPWKLNYSWKKIVTGLMERKTVCPHLQDVEIKHPVHGKWKTLTTSWICFVDRSSVPAAYWGWRSIINFRLSWCKCSP